MIIGRSPLRISLGGGGTDLPSYYREHGGFVVSGAITKYVYVTIHETPFTEFLIRYSQIERPKTVDEIRHPIVREALKLTEIIGPNIEITSMADIPAGTGLGSSGSFTTCLLRVLHAFKRQNIHPRELADMACHIEIDRLKEPVGKQDQHIAAFGGLTVFDFNKDDTVKARPVRASAETLDRLQHNLVMVSTGYYRAASQVLKEQDDKSKQQDKSMIDNLHYVKELGYKSLEALETGELERYAALMHEHWMHKKKRSSAMSNPEIDRWYALAMENGALGGKLIGAGGGGFLMFYTEERDRLRRALRAEKLMEVILSFDYEGTKILSA
jgi:D-glycero-alpha-D-manno-heptose-7-phosphate kinase